MPRARTIYAGWPTMPSTTKRNNVEKAADALRRLGGTYITRHAEEIARAAIYPHDEASAIVAVRGLIGHTSVGKRRYAELTKVARKAVAIEEAIDAAAEIAVARMRRAVE